MNEISKKIEAILFFKGEPMSIVALSKTLGESEQDIIDGLKNLYDQLEDRGIVLLENNGKVMLGTSPDFSGLIEGLLKEDLNKDLGKAGLETLSIVLYLGPIARSKIDYIRGVNSNFILRNLMIRGLVEKESNPEDKRAFLYRPTFELLSYLGISDIKKLPNYDSVKNEIEDFEKAEEDVNGKDKNESN